MTASTRPSAHRAGAGLVVVCCASDDAESLRDALTSLRGDGLEVELVEGLDQDPKRLTEVIDRRAGEGLYVLCRSPRLGRELVEELREVLLARHIPFARTLTVAVGGRGALADRIRSGLRRASARTSGPNRAATGATPELVATSRSRPLRTAHATEDEEPTLVGKRELGELGVPEPVDAPPSRRLPPPPTPTPPSVPRPSSPSVAKPSVATPKPTREPSIVETVEADAIEEDIETTAPREPLTAGPELDLSDLDETTGARRPSRVDTTAVGTPPPLITGNTVVGPAPVMITGETLVGQNLPRSVRELAERWPPPPPDRTAPPRPTASEASAPELELATTPLPRLPPAAPPPPPAPIPSGLAAPEASISHGMAPPSAASMSTARAVPDDDARPARGALPWVLGAVALLLLGVVIVLALSSGDDASEVASNDSADAPAPTPDPTPSDAAEADAKADEPPPGPRSYRVVDALAARKIRALDVLLMAVDRPKPADYATAEAYCRELDIDGLRGWRLPHIGELSSLAQASMIPRGMYWSSTAADTFGDGRMAWNVRRSHAEPHDDDAIAVCVRGGASGS